MSDGMNIEHRLEEIEEKVDQNLKILKAMRRKQIWAFWFGIVKIFLFIGVFYYAYHFAEPTLIKLKEAYVSFQGLSDSAESFKGVNLDFLKKANLPQ